jgi:hypothetical protein
VIDRRELIRLGVAAVAAVAWGCRRAATDLPLPERRHLAEAQRVGEAWLSAISPRPDADALADELVEGAPSDPEGFARHLRRRHEEDLAAGRTERVEGWLLSRTEAALYGLLASLPA